MEKSLHFASGVVENRALRPVEREFATSMASDVFGWGAVDVVYLTWEGARLPSSSLQATRLPRRVTCNNTCSRPRLVDETPTTPS